MIALLQRVTEAHVSVEKHIIASIGPGLLVLLGVQKGDTDTEVDELAAKVLNFRIFADEAGRMNRSVLDCEGSLLVVPQFTLAADTRKGTRPGFSTAADPEQGRVLFDRFVKLVAARIHQVGSGRFGAHMAVTLTNDGPATFWLEAPPAAGTR